ncbi:MAG: hypothetical protein JNL01_02085 [Bdellovibrionales bacterium]|nr:hypothetical protein [Bdellovibrionales bacterium]
MFSLLLALVFTPVSHAQDDGFHITPVTVCDAGDTCLIGADGQVIKQIEYPDFEGRMTVKLSTDSSLSDVIYAGSQSRCYVGATQDVCAIFEGLAENENAYFMQGGHTRIKKLSCALDSKEWIQLQFTVTSDMGSPEKVMQSFARCL